MFRKLCGDTALQNVIIVTNMWGEVSTRIGEKRERELREDNMFFKPVLDKGARIARHNNTAASAERIIRLLLKNDTLPLRIQEELVDEGKDITKTSAGEELNRELNKQIKKHQEEVKALREDLQAALVAKDKETRMELEIETQKMVKVIERLQHDSARLESDYKKEKERLEAVMHRVEREARKETNRVAAQYHQQIKDLMQLLKAATTENDKVRMQAQIDELTKKADRPPNFFSRLGSWVDGVLL